MALIYHNTQNYLNTFNPSLFKKIGENMAQPKIGKPLKNICNIDKIIIFDNFFTSFIKPPVKKIGENMSQPKIGKPLKNMCNIDKIIIFDNFFTSFIKPPVKKIYKKKVLTRSNSI